MRVSSVYTCKLGELSWKVLTISISNSDCGTRGQGHDKLFSNSQTGSKRGTFRQLSVVSMETLLESSSIQILICTCVRVLGLLCVINASLLIGCKHEEEANSNI